MAYRSFIMTTDGVLVTYIFASEETDIGKGDLIYSRETEKNIKNRMSVKNLVAVDWNSISLKFNTQKGKNPFRNPILYPFFCKFIILQHSVKHTHTHTHTHMTINFRYRLVFMKFITSFCHLLYISTLIFIRDRGGTVVKVLCYKSEGRWFDSRWCHWNILLT